METVLRPAQAASYVIGADVSARTLERAKIRVRFDAKDERAAEYARLQTGQLITEVEDDQRQWVRDLVMRAVTEGRTAQETARDIRERIGLHSRQIAALDRYRLDLQQAEVPSDKIARLVQKYADGLRRQRADLIARTELLKAVNEGKLAQIREGLTQGTIPRDRTFRQWILTDDERLCTDLCLPMSEADVGVVPIDQPWTLPDGRMVFNPTDSHPNCRCTFAIRLKQPGHEVNAT